MTTKAYEDTWAMYQAAWADITGTERRDLVSRSVSEDFVYSDPTGRASGPDELIAYIEGFLVASPGSTFKNSKLLDHHGDAVATWVALDANGDKAQDGNSYARFGDDGRLTRIIGFF